jgi:hypothetical protein
MHNVNLEWRLNARGTAASVRKPPMRVRAHALVSTLGNTVVLCFGIGRFSFVFCCRRIDSPLSARRHFGDLVLGRTRRNQGTRARQLDNFKVHVYSRVFTVLSHLHWSLDVVVLRAHFECSTA